MQSEFKYGFLSGGVISFCFYADEVYGKQIPSLPWMVNIIVFGAIGWAIYFAMREKREANRKEFIFSKAFLTGAFTCFYMACIVGAYSFSYAKYVNPAKGEQMIVEQKIIWSKEDKSPEFIENQSEKIRTLYSPLGQLESNAGIIVILGVLTSGVMGMVMKEKAK